MKGQAEEMINLNRTTLNEDLKKLEKERTITQSEYKQIHERLNADLDYYIRHQDIDLPGLEKMFFETVKNLENIRVNQSVFSTIIFTYSNITSQIAMRHSPIRQEDYAIQSDLNKIMNNWFDRYQNDSEKIADLIAQINKQSQLKSYPDISPSEYDDILSSITRIKKDATISNDEIRKILTDGMLKYCNKSNDSNLAVLNIYNEINRIKKLGMEEQLSVIYQSKWTSPKEPNYAEMKQQVSGRFKILLTEEMITQEEFENYTQTIIQDIEFCQKNKNTEQIKKQLLLSLKQLKTAELDTEDREAIMDWYFVLSQKTNIDIKSELNKWMYDFDAF